MRYKPQTPAPRYIGAVEEYDIYATPSGNVIARYGNDMASFARPHGWTKPGRGDLSANGWYKGIIKSRHSPPTRDVAERIAALIACFAPDLCAAHNKEEKTSVQQ